MAVVHLPVVDERGRSIGRGLDAGNEAFDEIYRTYKPALLAFCTSRLGSASEAEDASQEALLRAYRALPRFDRTQELWPWLATIAANVCIDMRRRRRPVPLSACREPRTEESVDPEDELARRMRSDLVGRAIKDLPEPYRRPVFLADVSGWSYRDIASHERTSVASVRTSIMRGRVAFKARVRELAEERGMWPIPAALPLARIRSRFLSWRATRKADELSMTASNAFAIAQAAAATIAVLSTIVPGMMAAGADEGGSGPSTAPIVRTSTSHDAASSPAAQAPWTSSATGAPVDTATDVDLGGDRKFVRGAVTLDTDGDGDDDGDAWIALDSDCEADTWHAECHVISDAVDDVIGSP